MVYALILFHYRRAEGDNQPDERVLQVLRMIESFDDKVVLAKVINDKITEALKIIHEFQNGSHWKGSCHYLVDWRPTMKTLREYLFFYRSAFSCVNKKPLDYEDFFRALRVLQEIQVVILDRCAKVELDALNRQRYQNVRFEPILCEFYRKIADIVLITKNSNMLEPLKEKCQLNFAGDIKVQSYAIAEGSKAVLGLMSLNDIIDLMPEIDQAHYAAIVAYRATKVDLTAQYVSLEGRELINFQQPEVEWSKKIAEMVTMSQFLLHHGYSQGWRTSLLAKLDEIRPVVRRGNLDSEFDEAHEYLNKEYYRMRKAYDQHRNRLERQDSFLREEIQRCG